MSKEFNINNTLEIEMRIKELIIRRKHDNKKTIKQLKKILKERKRNVKKNK